MSRLEIVIWSDTEPSVEELIFEDSITKSTRKLVRGRVSPHKGGSSFHFTSAVQSFVTLALRQAAFPDSPISLTGSAPSPALSLEYAILRKPSWIQDLFGVDAEGASLVLRYFIRVNAGFKRAAPLKVTINPTLLPARNIACSVNGRRVTQQDELGLLANYFEARWLERAALPSMTNLTSGERL